MHALESFDGFDFDHDRLLDKEVDAVAMVEQVILESHRQELLSLDIEPAI